MTRQAPLPPARRLRIPSVFSSSTYFCDRTVGVTDCPGADVRQCRRSHPAAGQQHLRPAACRAARSPIRAACAGSKPGAGRLFGTPARHRSHLDNNVARGYQISDLAPEARSARRDGPVGRAEGPDKLGVVSPSATSTAEQAGQLLGANCRSAATAPWSAAPDCQHRQRCAQAGATADAPAPFDVNLSPSPTSPPMAPPPHLRTRRAPA